MAGYDVLSYKIIRVWWATVDNYFLKICCLSDPHQIWQEWLSHYISLVYTAPECLFLCSKMLLVATPKKILGIRNAVQTWRRNLKEYSM